MRSRDRDPKIRDLHDLEGRQFLGMILIMLGILTVIFGAELLRKISETAMNQRDDLADRLEHLTESPSEPAKT